MKYNYLGKSGLRVSRLCLGAMTFGFSADIVLGADIMNALDAAHATALYPMG